MQIPLIETLIHSYIGFTRDCEVVIKLERLSHASIRLVFSVGLSYCVRESIIGVFIESRCIMGKGYLVSQEKVRSESYPECEPFTDIWLL